MSNDKQALLLVAHGSRGAAWNREVKALVEAVRAKGVYPFIECAYLGLARPTVPDAVASCAAAGVTTIAVVPLFLFTATHVRRDLPRILEQVSRRHPGLQFRAAPPFGVEKEVVTVLGERLASAARTLGVPPNTVGAVLVTGGTSDREANRTLEQVAARLREHTGVENVQAAFGEWVEPLLEEGLDRAVAAGARGIVILPYLLFPGTLVGRMRARVREWWRAHRQISVTVGGPLGPHPALAGLVIRRAREAFQQSK